MPPPSPQRLAWIDRPLAELPMPEGVMVLTRSLTSGLTRRIQDPPGVFWGVGDRGPNIAPGNAVKRYGVASLAALAGIEGAKVMPVPREGPSIARFRLVGDRVELEEIAALRAPDGSALAGLPPTALPGMESEPVFGLDGHALPTTADGTDTEGIAARPDGRFWVAEEYGPSLLLVRANGLVERRLVPLGAGEMFGRASIPSEEILPAIAAKRKLNRGFEALAVSPDGATLFVAFQSPLAHPDRRAHDEGDIVRIWALDAATAQFRAEFAYPLDHPERFRRDCPAGPDRNDVKVCELASLPDGSLLVLERVTLSTQVYRVRPEARLALPPCFLDTGHRPTLEQVGQAGAAQVGVPLLEKQLVLSTDVHDEICGDLEGMLVLDDGSLLLANDSDYGIEGAATQFWRVPMPCG